MKGLNMFRAPRARLTLLAVDESGMSTVEYSIINYYNGRNSATSQDPRVEGRMFRR